MQLPFHLQYELSRRQRLVPHLRIWGLYVPMLGGILLGAVYLARHGSPGWALLAASFGLWLYRGFIVGLFQVIRRPVQPMDLEIQENGLGFLDGNQRWWIFLDGVIHIAQLQKDTWTIQHHNGTVINIPATAITPEQLEHIRSASGRGLVRKE